MIELAMVRRMAVRALVLAPAVVGVLWLWRGGHYALSGVVGLAMALLNLYVSGRIIGGVAERHPGLLLVAGIGAFALGLAMLTGIAVALRDLDVIFFPVTGFVLIASHLGLVLWEAAGGPQGADA